MLEKKELFLYVLPRDLIQKIILEETIFEEFYNILLLSFLKKDENQTKTEEFIQHSHYIFDANMWRRLFQRDFGIYYSAIEKQAPSLEDKEVYRLFWKKSYLQKNASVYNTMVKSTRILLQNMALGNFDGFKIILDRIPKNESKEAIFNELIEQIVNHPEGSQLVANFKKNSEILEYLYKEVVANNKEENPLIATYCGQASKIDLSKISTKNKNYFLILKNATQFGHKEIVEKFSLHANIKEAINQFLTEAVHFRQYEIVELFLDWGADPSGYYAYRSPLFEAVVISDWRLFTLLLNHKKTDPNGRGSHSPLTAAAQKNDLEMVKALLAHKKIDPNGYMGCNPLYEAAKAGHTEIVKVLLKHPEIEREGIEHFNPLCAASENGHLEIVIILLAEDVNPNGNYRPNQVMTISVNPLYQACKNGHLTVVSELLGHKTGFTRNKAGVTPLEAAAGGGHLEVVKLLLENLDFSTEEKNKALTTACIQEENSIIDLLLYSGATINKFEGFYDYLLFFSAVPLTPFYPIMRLYFELEEKLHGFLIVSPLWRAVESGSLEAVKKLMQNGALKGFTLFDPQYGLRLSPHQKALYCGHQEIAAYLKWVNKPIVKDSYVLMYQVFCNYSKSLWGSENWAKFGRFIGGQWGNSYAGLVAKLLLQEEYKHRPFTRKSLIDFCIDLKNKMPENRNLKDDLLGILALMKAEAGIDFDSDLVPVALISEAHQDPSLII